MELLKDNKKREKLLGAITVVSIITFIIFFYFAKNAGIYAFISVIVGLISGYILIPLNKDYVEGKTEKKYTILKPILKLIVVTVFLLTMYMIFFQKNYNLKYTYYITFISFVIIILEVFYRNLRDQYRNRKKKENGKYKNFYLIFSIVYIVFMSILLFSRVADRISAPPREIVLQDMRLPKTITINKINNESYDDPLEFINNYDSVEIKNPKHIQKIIDELNAQQLKNISGIDIINYDRMKEDYDNQYSLYFDYFDYGEEGIGDERLKRGYIGNIVITSNRKAFIEEFREKNGIIYRNKYYSDILPIELSDNTIDMIRAYIR